MPEFPEKQVPLGISWSAGNGFENVQLIKDSIQKINQTNTKRCEQIKQLAYEMATCIEKV